jgi:hypothetical protein
MAAGQGYGYLQPNDTRGGYNPTRFIIQQALGRVRTLMLAQVKAVGAGIVDVQPLVSMVDSQGNAVNHGIIHGCPYLEMRAGISAIVAVPVVGDVGLIGVCDRDSSAALANPTPGPPPSAREFDMADAIYLFGISLGAAPTHTITVTPTGFVVSGNLTIEGNLLLGGTIEAAAGGTYAGNISTSGNVTAGTVSLKTHIHSGVTTGGGDSGPPV